VTIALPGSTPGQALRNVTKLAEHALQCAQFARTDGAGVELVAAAFLHDIGHLIVERPRFVGLQGGAFSASAASVFLGRRFARDAIRLRRWDDAAKVPGQPVPELADMTALLEWAAGCHKTAMAGA